MWTCLLIAPKGHVDAGKSTLMGRLLYETGRVNEKTRVAHERGSSKIGKASFSWAWELDGTLEERERRECSAFRIVVPDIRPRGITMDIGQQSLSTSHRVVTILDAPGHRDFIPNMISGASQADCAVLVVDAAAGEFEAGFDRGGQTREHLLLVRSLGVSQLLVAVNKLDQVCFHAEMALLFLIFTVESQVQWDKDRYEEICGIMKPFLLQSGFHPSRMKFVPVAASLGVNLADRQGTNAATLNRWYKGPTMIDLLGMCLYSSSLVVVRLIRIRRYLGATSTGHYGTVPITHFQCLQRNGIGHRSIWSSAKRRRPNR